MQKSSLEKWVDEIQGQIDALKRAMSIAPTPSAPEVVAMSGFFIPEVSGDTRLEGLAGIPATLDLTNYDYYMDIHYQETDVSDVICWDVQKHKIEPIVNSYLFFGVKSTSGTPALLGTASLSAVYAEGSINLTFDMPAGSIAHIGVPYVIIGIKKPATQSRTTKKK